MKILTIANEKGGVGKTLIAVQFAYYCAQKFGLRVGLIDFDQQSNSTTALIKNNSAKLSKITATELLVRESSTLKNLIEEDLKEQALLFALEQIMICLKLKDWDLIYIISSLEILLRIYNY